VIEQIRIQSGYDFFYSEKALQKSVPVNISADNVSLKEALDLCFKSQPLTYSIDNNAVVISQEEPSLLKKTKRREKPKK